MGSHGQIIYPRRGSRGIRKMVSAYETHPLGRHPSRYMLAVEQLQRETTDERGTGFVEGEPGNSCEAHPPVSHPES